LFDALAASEQMQSQQCSLEAGQWLDEMPIGAQLGRTHGALVGAVLRLVRLDFRDRIADDPVVL